MNMASPTPAQAAEESFAVQVARNPRSHLNITIDPGEALRRLRALREILPGEPQEVYEFGEALADCVEKVGEGRPVSPADLQLRLDWLMVPENSQFSWASEY